MLNEITIRILRRNYTVYFNCKLLSNLKNKTKNVHSLKQSKKEKMCVSAGNILQIVLW